MRFAASAVSRTSASAWSMARATRSFAKSSTPAMPLRRIGSRPKARSCAAAGDDAEDQRARGLLPAAEQAGGGDAGPGQRRRRRACAGAPAGGRRCGRRRPPRRAGPRSAATPTASARRSRRARRPSRRHCRARPRRARRTAAAAAAGTSAGAQADAAGAAAAEGSPAAPPCPGLPGRPEAPPGREASAVALGHQPSAPKPVARTMAASTMKPRNCGIERFMRGPFLTATCPRNIVGPPTRCQTRARYIAGLGRGAAPARRRRRQLGQPPFFVARFAVKQTTNSCPGCCRSRTCAVSRA